MHTTKQTKLVRKNTKVYILARHDHMCEVCVVTITKLINLQKHKSTKIRNNTSCTKKMISCCRRMNNVGTIAMQEYL